MSSVRTPAERACTDPVWPCRKCDRPQAPHRVDCFWATHRQGAVEGMRYAWTPSEAKLGAVIEQQEDEARALRAELAEARLNSQALAIGCIVLMVIFTLVAFS